MGDYPFGPGFERDTHGVYEPTSKRKWRMGTRIHIREPCTCTYTYTYAFSLKLASRSSLPTSSSTLIATVATPAPTASGNECAAFPSAFCA